MQNKSEINQEVKTAQLISENADLNDYFALIHTFNWVTALCLNFQDTELFQITEEQPWL